MDVKLIPKTATINALVPLSLNPTTNDSDFIQVKYHKDQANDKDYSYEGVGFSFKKWQADNVMKYIEVQMFKADSGTGAIDPGKMEVKRYGSGTADAPERNL